MTMQTLTQICSHDALSSFENARRICESQTKRKKTLIINAETIFRGSYWYIRETELREPFAQLLHLNTAKHLDQQYLKTYQQFSKTSQGATLKEILLEQSFSQKLIGHKNKRKIQQIDVFFLFYISFLDLSRDSEILHLLKKDKITQKTIIENWKKMVANPISQQQGTFAFLQLLNKLISALPFNLNESTNMQIQIAELNGKKAEINFNLEQLEGILDAIESDIGLEAETNNNKKQQNNASSTTATTSKKEEKKLTIEYFGTDLTKEAKEGAMDPVIGRENEINQVIYTLLRKTKNNPLLIGEPGVGKTAIIEGLAQRINTGNVPTKLKGKKIFLLDMGTLVAGTKYRGEFESRMKAILEEATDPTNHIILFIDELHTIIGAGGQEHNDAAQMLKPLLSRGKLKLIGATTFDEYQKVIEKDAALKRRFQEIIVNEPNEDITKEIISGLKQTYEDFHGVNILPEAIDAAIHLSKRYILNKHLPDKALDILDEACARESTMQEKLSHDNRYQKTEKEIEHIEEEIEKAIENQEYFIAAELKEKEESLKKELNQIRMNKNIPTYLRSEIDAKDIGNVLAEKTGIPVNIVNEDEISKLKRLDSILKHNIIGQDEAVDAVVRTLTRSRLSKVARKKPIGSFLFLWPSGVGKTYLAKLIAKEYFGDENAMIRLDMSEFMEKFSVSKLIGSPAGYVGFDESGGLTESVRRKPYSVVLFDEIEKAAPDVLNILLQILDEGTLKDNKGRIIDFKSTIIIMTSNIGSDEFSKKQISIGFSTEKKAEATEKDFDKIKERMTEQLKNHLSPELLNRIDYKVIFHPLYKESLTKIFNHQLANFLEMRKGNPAVTLPKFTKKQINEIIDNIYDPQYGARPVERYIQNEIEGEMIKALLK